MLPNDPHNRVGEPTHLPPVAAGQAPAPAPAGTGAAQAVGPDAAEQYSVKAKQLIAQYGNDPYRLGEAISQLKAGYLAQHHNITLNAAGS